MSTEVTPSDEAGPRLLADGASSVGPVDAAAELREVFGIYWCQALIIELSRAMGVRP